MRIFARAVTVGAIFLGVVFLLEYSLSNTAISGPPPHPAYLEFIKKFDKNGDGKLDEKERLEIRKLYGRRPTTGSFAPLGPKKPVEVAKEGEVRESPECKCDCKCKDCKCNKPKREKKPRRSRKQKRGEK
jgi:hypothetical protein